MKGVPFIAVFALSPFETFGLSAAEAMASGSALIAADRGAVSEFVMRAECGVLVLYNDVEALAERTIALLSSGQLAQAGERAYRYATQHLSWTAAFDRMVDFYHDIVATVRRGG
jgi:glycosyltransferase involved in cell wall biosynthesis